MKKLILLGESLLICNFKMKQSEYLYLIINCA